MKFSVIIPVYNAEKTINRCVDSIINQQFKDFELILVNDGSSDRSSDICIRYQQEHSNIKFFSKENGGASSARNLGIKNASGDYLLFVDSDDYVDSNYFNVLESVCVPDGLSVLTFSIKNGDVVKKRNIDDYYDKSGVSNFEKIQYLMSSRTINSPYAKIFDRALVKKTNLRFEENMPVAEDFNFCLRYAINCKKINIVNQSVYYYDLGNDNSLVHKRKENMIEVYPLVFDYAFNTINNSGFSNEEKKALLRIWDKLHTDSFITCIMEELKDKALGVTEIIKRIRHMCKKFYSEYKPIYGYENFVHFSVRFCIKYRLATVLYMMCKVYSKTR